MHIYVILVMILISVKSVLCLSLDSVFIAGDKAFDEEEWFSCVKHFEDLKHLHKVYERIISVCRLNCQREPFVPLVDDEIEDLQVYEMFLKRSDCLMKCENSGFDQAKINPYVSESLSAKLKDLKYYSYLHICLFRRNRIQEAASAAYTYYLAHPEDKIAKNDYEYYIHLPEVDLDKVVNYEQMDYKETYKQGLESYKKQNWGETIENFKSTINSYIVYENECRILCEGPKEETGERDFVTGIAEFFLLTLKCKQNCQNNLSTLQYSSGIEFFADLLNYLQFSNYQLENIIEAVKAVETFLILNPNDKDMIRNKKIYKTIINETEFKPIEVIHNYFKRDNYEKKILNYVNNHFGKSKSLILYDTVFAK